MESKTWQGFDTKVSDQGIVETIFAVMGVIDSVSDIVHPGSFTKTFTERGHKIRVLNHHRAQSINDIIGKPLELRELSKAELPPKLLEEYPEATGGAYAKVQLLMDTPEGEGAYKRLRAKAADEWSFGYDVLDKDFSQVKVDGKEVSIRNLRTLKLYELSPVIFGAQSATTTLSAKEAEEKDEPTEAKPWGVHPQGQQFCVYKHDEDGNPVGKPLGCHDTEDEAQAQMRALYAAEDEGKAISQEEVDEIKQRVSEPSEPLTLEHLEAFDDRIREIWNAINELKEDDAPADSEPVEEQAAQEAQAETQAGPDGDETPEPPTSEELMLRIRLEQERLSLLEV